MTDEIQFNLCITAKCGVTKFTYNIFKFDFFARAHLKRTFHDNIRMIRTLRILAGEEKRAIEVIGGNDIFALFPPKMLVNQQAVTLNRFFSAFDKVHIKANDKVGLNQLK